MLTKITQLLNAANPDYIVEYEEASMMNVKADEYDYCARFIYIEEFVRGRYTQLRYKGFTCVMRMQIYFCRFTQFQNDAIKREKIRQEIITEIVEPFINAFNSSNFFDRVDEWTLNYPLPRFDANEVSVMLEFDCIMKIC